MQKINLRDLYPDVYKTDAFLEVTDEVQAVFQADERAEAAYERKMYRYKAQYSLDCENGIENAVLRKLETPAMLLEIPAGSLGTAYVPWALLTILAGCIVMVSVGVLEERGVDVRQAISDALPFPVVVLVWGLLFLLIGMFGCTAAPRGFIYAQF